MSTMSMSLRNTTHLLRRSKYGVVIFSCFTVSIIYFAFALYYNPNLFAPTPMNYYPYLLDAFFHGRVNVTPPITYDLSFFQHKWYMYWGPSPALLMLPLYLIFHLNLADIVLTLFVGIANVAIFYFVIQEFKKYFNISLSSFAEIFLLLSFGLASPNFILSLVGRIWFTEQVSSILYLLVFYLFYFKFLNNEKYTYFIVATIFFYLSCLGRYTLAFNVVLFPYLFLHYKGLGRKIPLKIIWSFGIITLFFVSAGFVYNYLRFQNILETGLRYQVGGTRYAAAMASNQLFSITYIPHNVYYYFLNIIHFVPNWQPVVLDVEGNSVFSVYPALLLLPVIFYKARQMDKKKQMFLITAGIIIGLTVLLLLLYVATGWVQFGSRYFLDVIPLLFLLLTFVLQYIPVSVQGGLLFYGAFVNLYGTLAFFTIVPFLARIP